MMCMTDLSSRCTLLNSCFLDTLGFSNLFLGVIILVNCCPFARKRKGAILNECKKYFNKPFFVAFRGIARHCNYLGDLLLALISYRSRRPCCIVIVDRDDHAELNGKFFYTLFFDIQF